MKQWITHMDLIKTIIIAVTPQFGSKTMRKWKYLLNQDLEQQSHQ